MSATEESLLTAYALNELEGAELAQIERLLQDDTAMRAEVDAIQSFCGAIGAALADEPIQGARSEATSVRSSAFIRWALSLAAAMVLGLGITHFARRKLTRIQPQQIVAPPSAEVIALDRMEKNRARDRGERGTLEGFRERAASHFFDPRPTPGPTIRVPEVTLANNWKRGFGEPNIGIVSSGVILANVVPAAEPVMLSARGARLPAGLRRAPSLSIPIVPEMLLQVLNSPPPSTDLRPNFSYRSPVLPRSVSDPFGPSSSQIIPLPGFVGEPGTGDRSHPVLDGPRPGEPVRYFTPDPRFDRSDEGRQGPEAKLQVVVPRIDFDRGSLIWAVPGPQPPKSPPAPPK